MAFVGDPMPESQVTTFMQVITPRSAYDAPPKFLHGYAPFFPPRLAGKGYWGYAALDFNIETDGSTSDIRMIAARGYDFAQEAAYAVGKWRFLPAQKNGQPVRVRVQLPFTFRS
jgi:TonB family protein